MNPAFGLASEQTAKCTCVYWPVYFIAIKWAGAVSCAQSIAQLVKRRCKTQTTATAPHLSFQAPCPGSLWQLLSVSFGLRQLPVIRQKMTSHIRSLATHLHSAVGKTQHRFYQRPMRGWFCSYESWGLTPPIFYIDGSMTHIKKYSLNN